MALVVLDLVLVPLLHLHRVLPVDQAELELRQRFLAGVELAEPVEVPELSPHRVAHGKLVERLHAFHGTGILGRHHA